MAKTPEQLEAHRASSSHRQLERDLAESRPISELLAIIDRSLATLSGSDVEGSVPFKR